MSNDIIMAEASKPKQERKDKKDKKDKKAQATVDVPAATTAELTSETKDKKKKKRKLEVEAGEADAAKGEADAKAEDKPKKKKKKDKAAKESDAAESAAVIPASTEVVTPAEDSAAEPALSKKQLKKLAKAAKASAASAGDAGASSSSAPGSAPAQLTPDSPEFLAAAASPAATTAFLGEHWITLTPATFPAFLSLASLPIASALRPYLAPFSAPTPIQACSWPPLFVGRDVVGIAETGSGKTLSFGLPGLQRLSASLKLGKKPTGSKGQILLLVLAPTRELALQTHETLAALGKLVGINAVCLFGGVNKYEQVAEIRKKETRIVVGTPGRILDLAQSNEVDFSGVNYLVLDEADRMLDQGFENDIRRIIALCPGKEDGRQTVMFSATWPESVRRLASTFLTDSVKITVGSDELSANKRIEQIVEVLDDGRGKDPRLLHHLRTHLKTNPPTAGKPTRILVFALYKKEASRLEGTIRRAGYTVAGLHGDLDQNARFRALDAFKEGKVQVLVATDVAARGLDIPDVNLVINVTFPLTTEDFVHRCGRTGRAGKTGKAVTFFTGENHERSLAGEFMRVLRDVGAEIPSEMDRFPSTIKKKEHGAYGAFYKDTSDAPAPKKIVFD